MKRVFLGGTCNGSTWREELIPLLTIDYFNPVVEDWTPECQAREIIERKKCDFVLYVITPEMAGFYSIAEVIDDSNKRPDKTIFCVLRGQKQPYTGIRKFTPNQYPHFNQAQLKSLEAVEAMVLNNGAGLCYSLRQVATYLDGTQSC